MNKIVHDKITLETVIKTIARKIYVVKHVGNKLKLLLWKRNWYHLVKLKIFISYGPTILLVDIYSRENLAFGVLTAYSKLFKILEVMIIKNLKDSKCQSAIEQVNYDIFYNGIVHKRDT